MRTIINKFREIFDGYDYHNHKVDKLVSAINYLMQIMTSVDSGDQEYIKKISSFITLVSSDIDGELLDIGMVEYIYATKITPILDYFEYKYRDVNVKSTTEIVKDMLQDQYVLIETDVNTNYNKMVNKKMFGTIKEVGVNLERIYKDIANQCMNKERSVEALRDLKKTSKTMSLLNELDNISLLNISDSIKGLSDIMYECIEHKEISTNIDNLLNMGFERVKFLEFVSD